jgi:hypothetical protein
VNVFKYNRYLQKYSYLIVSDERGGGIVCLDEGERPYEAFQETVARQA